jgi:hypothetical protein
MREYRKKILISSFVLALSLSASSASAQTTASQGLTISPFLLERQMDKGQTLNEIIDAVNTTNRTLPVDISVMDFIPVGDNGQQQYLDPGQGDPHFSLSSWISIKNNPKQVLKPNERTEVNFSITAPQNADNGSHWGAVMFSFQGPAVSGSAVQVTQKIGAIVLIKLGKAQEDGRITNFQTDKNFYEYSPVRFLTSFNNTGNVHVKPRGAITITNSFGKKVGSVLVNENANNVLPQSSRTFESMWKDKFAFGKYTADVQLVFGDSGTVVSAETNFWVIPWKLTIGLGLLLFIVLIILIQGLKIYNRWLINKAYGARSRYKKN